MTRLFLGKVLTIAAAFSSTTILMTSPSRDEFIKVSAQGKLESVNNVKKVRASISGVVKKVFVKDGDKVKAGDLLVQLESTVPKSQLSSLASTKAALEEENRFYRSQLSPGAAKTAPTSTIKPKVLALTRSRNALAAENQQLKQTQARITAGEQALKKNQAILADLEPAVSQGAISRVQFNRQKQQVDSIVSELQQQKQELHRLNLEKQRLISAKSTTAQNQRQRIQEQEQLIAQRTSTIAQLDEELARLQLSSRQRPVNLSQFVVGKQKEIYARISENDKRIAEIDSQINKLIIENEKKITELGSQLTQASQNLKYQEIRSPADGTVFELKAFNEGLVNSNSPDAIVLIVPDNDLVAKIYITKEDIGFVTSRFEEAKQTGEPLKVDVRIDSFNFSEFGDVKGTLEWIGSDVLPPDQAYQFYRFPAKIRLDKQVISLKGKDIQLQNGMSINVNIKLRDRTRQGDAMKNTR